MKGYVETFAPNCLQHTRSLGLGMLDRAVPASKTIVSPRSTATINDGVDLAVRYRIRSPVRCNLMLRRAVPWILMGCCILAATINQNLMSWPPPMGPKLIYVATILWA